MTLHTKSHEAYANTQFSDRNKSLNDGKAGCEK
jgi:hypothetical protein